MVDGLAWPRFDPEGGYYYVFGGGNDVMITRSQDLSSSSSWERRNMSMATHCIAFDTCVQFRPACTADAVDFQECCGISPDCSPASGEGRIAPGYFTEYWANESDCHGTNTADGTSVVCRRDFLSNMSGWDWSVSDADFCDEGGRAPTRFIYAANQQTKPKNATTGAGGGGYHMGVFNGTELEWLRSFFSSPTSGGGRRRREGEN